MLPNYVQSCIFAMLVGWRERTCLIPTYKLSKKPKTKKCDKRTRKMHKLLGWMQSVWTNKRGFEHTWGIQALRGALGRARVAELNENSVTSNWKTWQPLPFDMLKQRRKKPSALWLPYKTKYKSTIHPQILRDAIQNVRLNRSMTA